MQSVLILVEPTVLQCVTCILQFELFFDVLYINGTGRLY